jgi:hypothetical protein
MSITTVRDSCLPKICHLPTPLRSHGATSVADSGCLSRIPDLGFFHPGSWIPDPGSQIHGSKYFLPRIPDPGSTPKNLSILTPKNCFQALRNMIWVVHPGSGSRILIFYPSWIQNSRCRGSIRHRTTDSGSRIRKAKRNVLKT